MTDDPDLEGAYNISGPAEAKKLYRDWATTYDEDFASERMYLLPAKVAEVFAGHASEDDAPVLDVGVGTGLVGEALWGQGSWPLDGLDISPEMLAVARTRGMYGDLMEVDLTQPLSLRRNRWGGLVSAGTFTHGHLGPEVLISLLDVVRPGGLFVVSINVAHFETLGFAGAFEEMEQFISEPIFVETPIYGTEIGDEHDEDTAYIGVWRRL